VSIVTLGAATRGLKMMQRFSLPRSLALASLHGAPRQHTNVQFEPPHALSMRASLHGTGAQAQQRHRMRIIPSRNMHDAASQTSLPRLRTRVFSGLFCRKRKLQASITLLTRAASAHIKK